MEKEKRKPGHPACTPEEKRITISCRIDPSTRDYMKERGLKPGRLLDRVVSIMKESGVPDLASWPPPKYTASEAWLDNFTYRTGVHSQITNEGDR